MAQVRVEKVQEMIKQEVSNIVLNEIKDPRVKFVTITAVQVTNDLQNAKIYVSLYGKEEEKQDCLKGLSSALGFIRKQIGQRIRLRVTPELSIHEDKSLEYSEHIQKLLIKIQE